MLETILNWGIGSLVLALLAIGVTIMGLTPPDFQAAKVCFSLAVLLVLIRFGAWLIIAQWSGQRKIITAVLICSIIGAIWALLIIWVEKREKAITVRPILRIKPVGSPGMLQWLKWPDRSVLPSKKDDKYPLAVLLTNVGNERAIDVEMIFRSPLGMEEVRTELNSSGVLPEFKIDGNEVTIPLEFGKQYSSAPISLGINNIRVIDAVDFEPGHNEKRVEYPSETQNGLILWILSQAYRFGQIRDSKFKQFAEEFHKLQKEEDPEKFLEYGDKWIREGQFDCLPINIIISYKDIAEHNFSEMYVIIPVFLPIDTPKWIIDGENRYFHGGTGNIAFKNKEGPSRSILKTRGKYSNVPKE